MATVVRCKECYGTGQVEWTKERGGPKCNSCGGHGFKTKEMIETIIACMLDHPSVYMGGPSPGNRKRAKKIVDYLMDEELLLTVSGEEQHEIPPKS